MYPEALLHVAPAKRLRRLPTGAPLRSSLQPHEISAAKTLPQVGSLRLLCALALRLGLLATHRQLRTVTYTFWHDELPLGLASDLAHGLLAPHFAAMIPGFVWRSRVIAVVAGTEVSSSLRVIPLNFHVWVTKANSVFLSPISTRRHKLFLSI